MFGLKLSSPATIAVLSAVGGCHANVVSLEQLLNSPEGKAFSSCLTFFQFLFVAIISLRYMVCWDSPPPTGLEGNVAGNMESADKDRKKDVRGNEVDYSPSSSSLSPARSSRRSTLCQVRLRPLQISLNFHLLIAASFWVISFFNNYALSIGIPVPVHTVFRSSSLLFNIALGYFAFSRRYSAQQLVCAFVIVIGLIVLSLAPVYIRVGGDGTSSSSVSSSRISSTVSDEGVYAKSSDRSEMDGGGVEGDLSNWFTGILILAWVSCISPLLSLLQEKAMAEASKRGEEKANNKRNAEHTTDGLGALATRDIASVKSSSNAGGTNSGAEENPPSTPIGEVKDDNVGSDAYAPLWAEMTCCAHLLSLPLFAANLATLPSAVAGLRASEHLLPILVNLVTQYVCVSSVYQLVAVVGSFTMTLTTTMRKFLSLLFSIFYFGHYKELTVVEWVAILGIGIAGAAYPFLPKKGVSNNAASPNISSLSNTSKTEAKRSHQKQKEKED